MASIPTINRAREESIRNTRVLAGALGIIAVGIAIVWLQWFPLPVLVTTVTLSFLGVIMVLNYFAFQHLGPHSPVYEAKHQLASAEAALKNREQATVLYDDWLATLERTASALFILDAEGEILAGRGSATFLVEELAIMARSTITHEWQDADPDDRPPLNLYGVLVPGFENRYADIRIVPLPFHQAQQRYAILIQDATDRMQLDANQQELHDKLAMADKMGALGTLAAGMAHEINNPLTYILGNIEYLRTNALSPQATRSLDDVQAGFKHISSIVQDLKVFSYPSRQGDFAHSDLRTVCRRVERMIRAELRTVATLQVELPDSPVTVACRPDQIHQVLLNLLINAKQAFHQDAQATNLIRLRLSFDQEQAYIQVVDNGKGVATEHLRQIFDPFFTTKRPGVGTGLGLSVSYSIAVEHGGRLGVQANPEGGTIFTLGLPLVGGDSRTDARYPILIIDDEERTLKLLSKVFVEYEVSTASTIEEARCALGEHFRAVLCDIRLPGGLGFQLYQEASETLRKRFLFLTALPRHAAEMQLSPAEATVLHKPIPLYKLRNHLHGVVNGEAQHEQELT